jgi:putative polyhydroxyalkanoate system protein
MNGLLTMSELKVIREHSLGFERARKVAAKWAELAEQRHETRLKHVQGETADTFEFKRSGVSGLVTVSERHFEITAKLGFLLQPFHAKIESEVIKQLDTALAREAAKGG